MVLWTGAGSHRCLRFCKLIPLHDGSAISMKIWSENFTKNGIGIYSGPLLLTEHKVWWYHFSGLIVTEAYTGKSLGSFFFILTIYPSSHRISGAGVDDHQVQSSNGIRGILPRNIIGPGWSDGDGFGADLNWLKGHALGNTSEWAPQVGTQKGIQKWVNGTAWNHQTVSGISQRVTRIVSMGDCHKLNSSQWLLRRYFASIPESGFVP